MHIIIWDISVAHMGPKVDVGVFLTHSSLHALRQGLTSAANLANQCALQHLPQVLGLQPSCLPGFYIGSRTPNPSPHTRMARALSTEPSPRPLIRI